MTHTFDLPGHPAHDDPEVVRLMATVDTLTDGERRTLILNGVRYALAHRRTGDVAHLTEWRKNMLGTLHLRGIPAYVEAVRRPVPPRTGPGLDIGEVLASLGREA